MSLYSEVYNQVLTEAQTKYKKLHNLYLLKGLRQKINCYKNNLNKPDQYYDCFFEIQGNMLRQSSQFVNNCSQIDDDYKICLSDCKQNFKNDDKKKQECFKTCGTKFRNSISFLYNNFYETNVSKQAEYKAAKKN